MKKRTSLIDKSVKLNIDMCFTEIILVDLVMILIFYQLFTIFVEDEFAFMNSYGLMSMRVIFLLPMMAICLIAVLRAFSKIYYRSIFGDSSYLYMPIPFNSMEVVIGKVTTGTIALLIPMLLILSMTFVKGNMSELAISLFGYANVPAGSQSLFTVLMIWDMAFAIFQFNTEIFLAVVLMESFSISDIKFVKVVIFLLAIVVIEIIKNIPTIIFPLETYPIMSLVVEMVTVLAIAVATIYVLIKYFDNKYELI